MKLSIVVPVYNVEQWLPETIESLLAQTFRDFELILVNDGSTDGSAKVCDRYAAIDNRVRVVHQKNAGVSVARNVGLREAKGEYIGFTDSDDIAEADMYAVMLKLAYEHGADIVQCQHDRECVSVTNHRSGDVVTMDGQEFVRRIFVKTGGDYTNQVALWSKIYRRELFEGIVFPAGRVYEDEQETYKLCLKAKRIVETPDVLYHYIKRENSIITGISAKKMLDKQQALLDRMNYLPSRIPDLEKECCERFLRYSENIMCQMYRFGEMNAVDQAIDVLLSKKGQLKPYLNRYEKLYLPVLKWAKRWILRNEFAPIQKWIAKVKNRL